MNAPPCRPFLATAAMSFLMLVTPANAFVADASSRAPRDPDAAAATTARWNANQDALVHTGERGLGGGLEFSLDEAFCGSLEFVDGASCADVRALIVEAGAKWGVDHPNISLVDVTGAIRAREPGNFATNLELGAEINFFARSRDEMEREVEEATASAGLMTSYVKPQSTNGTTLWEADGTITHASVHFSTDHCYYLIEPTDRSECASFGLVLLHELGHVLGLGHPDELTEWNLDSDDDPATPIEIDCLAPLAGLHHSPVYDTSAIMISSQSYGPAWEDALKPDDLAGRDFLYPVCSPEEIASERIAEDAPRPTLSVPVNANFYPIDSLLQNEEGTVLMSLTIAPDQSVSGAELHTSSGYPELDQAAIAIGSNSRFAANQGVANGAGGETILASAVWELPLRPAFDIGMLSSDASNLDKLPQLVDLPENQNLIQVPDASALAGEQGVVRISVTISNSGDVSSAEIVESSGYLGLDNAAVALTNASNYDPATSNGLAVEASLQMAFAYDSLPGTPSPHCYPYPVDVNLPTIRLAYYSYQIVDEDKKPSAERWVQVDQTGEIETMILATERGWMHVDDTLMQRWGPSAVIPDEHPQQSCWYYRPFVIPRR